MYHLSVKFFSRKKGQSVIAAAAYRSGERLHDRYYGLTPDFTKKRGIVHRQIILHPNAPREFNDRETLWNAVEFAEKRRNSRLAREVELALPSELVLDEHIKMVERYVAANFVDKGMCADVCYHDKSDGNPHVHILLTTRDVNGNGFGRKNRNWDKKENVSFWRQDWANVLNREYKRIGSEKRVSHERNLDRDIVQEPTIHLGYRVMRTKHTDRRSEYDDIVRRNRKIDEHERQRQQKKERDKRREHNSERGR